MIGCGKGCARQLSRAQRTNMALSRMATSQAGSLTTLELFERLRLAVRLANRLFRGHLRVIPGDDTRVERLRTTSRRWWQPISDNAMPQTSSMRTARAFGGGTGISRQKLAAETVAKPYAVTGDLAGISGDRWYSAALKARNPPVNVICC